MSLPSSEFLASVTPAMLDNQAGLSMTDRALLLTLLRVYFGAAQVAGEVKDVSDPASLASLDVSMRAPGERFDLLEQQSSLPTGYFSGTAEVGDLILVARQENGHHPASFFVYAQAARLVAYVGPDFFHGEPEHIVVNCLTLDERFKPTGSYTLRA